jgi:hypothetical protein
MRIERATHRSINCFGGETLTSELKELKDIHSFGEHIELNPLCQCWQWKMLWKKLTENEEKQFREWARKNYEPLTAIDGLWHPTVQEECVKINVEKQSLTNFQNVSDLARLILDRKQLLKQTAKESAGKPLFLLRYE